MSYFDDNENYLTGIPRRVERQINNAKGYTMAKENPTKVITGEVRLCYVHLFEPYAYEAGQEPKYSCMILIPKSDKATLAKVKAAQEAAVAQGVATKWGGKKPKKLGNTLRDGDEEQPGEGGDEFDGHYFMNVSCKTAPHVVDRALNPVMDSSEVYSGCYARVSISFFPYATAGNNGVSAGLNNVQFVRDGESLGGRSRAEDDFDALDDGDDEGAYDDLLGL